MASNQVAVSFRCVTGEWHRIEGTDVEVTWGGHTFDQQGRLIFTLIARRIEEQTDDAPDGGR